MTIPEPWSTLLFLNMAIGLIVSTLTGSWFVAWLTEKFVDRLTLTFKVHTFFLRFIWHRKDFMEWQARQQMGWASGSDVFSGIIETLKPKVGDNLRKGIYLDLIPVFENHDCDTLSDCLGEDDAFDAAYTELNPTEDDNDDSDLEEDGD